jgi:transposase InsO family protein
LRRPVEPKQYACGDYQAALSQAGITPSISRRANPLDNAPMESFFHTLKTELVHHRTYVTRDKAKRDLFAYVEGFYNHQRLHSALDYRTPNQAEQQAVKVAQTVHKNRRGSHQHQAIFSHMEVDLVRF